MNPIARHNPVLGVLWMTGAAIFFSVALALVRHLSQTLTVFEIALFRLGFGVIVMAPWLARAGLAGLRTDNFRFSIAGGRCLPISACWRATIRWF